MQGEVTEVFHQQIQSFILSLIYIVRLHSSPPTDHWDSSLSSAVQINMDFVGGAT
jgi:hypothetical protein